jgi:DNA-binding transcriptional MerR regulator
MQFTIGQIAKAADCKVQTVRYYEQVGLLPRAERSNGNQRIYAKSDVDRLTFIRHARDLGFPVEAIRDLLSLADRPDQPCEAADAIARAQLAHVERRIEHLQALKLELHRMIDQCSGGRISDCRVIEVLGDHAKCAVHGQTHASHD